MKKLLAIAALVCISGAVVASAAASLRTYTAGTKYVKGAGTVGSFAATVQKPYKLILYCEGVNARCGAKVVCVRGSSTFTWNRSRLTPGTWNLKKKTWYRVTSCHLKATIRSGFKNARVTVQATVRS